MSDPTHCFDCDGEYGYETTPYPVDLPSGQEIIVPNVVSLKCKSCGERVISPDMSRYIEAYADEYKAFNIAWNLGGWPSTSHPKDLAFHAWMSRARKPSDAMTQIYVRQLEKLADAKTKERDDFRAMLQTLVNEKTVGAADNLESAKQLLKATI